MQNTFRIESNDEMQPGDLLGVLFDEPQRTGQTFMSRVTYEDVIERAVAQGWTVIIHPSHLEEIRARALALGATIAPPRAEELAAEKRAASRDISPIGG